MAIKNELIDLNVRAKEIQYRMRDYIRDFLVRYADVMNGINLHNKIDVEFERSPQHMAYIMTIRIYINRDPMTGNKGQVWQYSHMIDDDVFELGHDARRIEYFEHLVRICQRTCQTGIIAAWLDDLMGEQDDDRMQQVWRSKVQPMVQEFNLTTLGTSEFIQGDDLLHVVIRDFAYPITNLVKEIKAEPKLFLARLLMVIK